MRTACLFWSEAGKTPPQRQAALVPSTGQQALCPACHPTDHTHSHNFTHHHFRGEHGEVKAEETQGPSPGEGQ